MPIEHTTPAGESLHLFGTCDGCGSRVHEIVKCRAEILDAARHERIPLRCPECAGTGPVFTPPPADTPTLSRGDRLLGLAIVVAACYGILCFVRLLWGWVQ